jgi:hypothetical protein
MERKLPALEQQAADILRRARRLPIGAERNDLRQLAVGLLWLHRNGMDALMEQRSASRPLTTPVEHELGTWRPCLLASASPRDWKRGAP